MSKTYKFINMMDDEYESIRSFQKMFPCHGPLCRGIKRPEEDYENSNYCYECTDYYDAMEGVSNNG